MKPHGKRIPQLPVKSDNIASVGYDPAAKLLSVTFRDGSEYDYAGVPEPTYRQLMSAPSKTKYLRGSIVPAHRGVKVK